MAITGADTDNVVNKDREEARMQRRMRVAPRYLVPAVAAVVDSGSGVPRLLLPGRRRQHPPRSIGPQPLWGREEE